jgi:hypothetical protein
MDSFQAYFGSFIRLQPHKVCSGVIMHIKGYYSKVFTSFRLLRYKCIAGRVTG